MKKILAALFLFCAGAPVQAQQTKAALTTEINTNFASGVPGGITAATLRTTTTDIINSIMPTAPVVNNNLVCFDGTTGLLKDCTVVGSPITALTGDVTATGPGSVAATLATVNANVGAFGSASVVSTFTVNAKGLITAASNASIALPVGQITGLGTGVATALAVNVGTAGSPVVNGGALGTPSSGTLTNATGYTVANLSGAGGGVLAWLATPSSANLASAVTGETGSGALVFGTAPTITGATLTTTSVNGVTIGGAGQYPGEPSTGSASAGNIGEYVESILASGSATSLVTGTAKTITSISLTAGDWDVDCIIYFIPAASTSVTQLRASMSLTTNTDATAPGSFIQNPMAAVVSGGSALSAGVNPYRFSLSGTTSIFLVADQTFSVSTLTGFGIIRARRAR